MDRVVSSYMTTVRALADTRDHTPPSPPEQSLIVSMPTTPGFAPFPAARTEATRLQEILPQPTVLMENTASKASVLARLAAVGIAHFACHAVSNIADPSQSRLILHDAPLTAAELASIRLNQAQLAYLSTSDISPGAQPGIPGEAIRLTVHLHHLRR